MSEVTWTDTLGAARENADADRPALVYFWAPG